MTARKSQPHSIARRLLRLTIGSTIVLVLLAALFSGWSASRSIRQVFDEQMRESADILLAFLHYELVEDTQGDEEESQAEVVADLNAEVAAIVTQIQQQYSLSTNYRVRVNRRTLFTAPRVHYFPVCAEGFSEIEVTEEQGLDTEWRCFSRQQITASGAVIEVEFFEQLIERERAVRNLVINALAPLLLIPLLIAAAAIWSIRKGLAPLNQLGEAISQRSVNDLSQIASDSQPSELQPLTASMNQMLRGIERGIEREKRFTDDAAHELRTPLTSIKMLEQLIRRDAVNPDLTEHLDSLRNSVDQGTQMIDQLLEFARLQGAREMEKEPVSIQEIIAELLGLLSPQITGKSLAVDLEMPEQAVVVNANRHGLRLLVRNLLTNAIKFARHDGQIGITLTGNALIIADDGPGVSAEEREKVFDRFYRSTEASPVSGSGLGLSLAMWVASAHGYTLTVGESDALGGAAFSLGFSRN